MRVFFKVCFVNLFLICTCFPCAKDPVCLSLKKYIYQNLTDGVLLNYAMALIDYNKEELFAVYKENGINLKIKLSGKYKKAVLLSIMRLNSSGEIPYPKEDAFKGNSLSIETSDGFCLWRFSSIHWYKNVFVNANGIGFESKCPNEIERLFPRNSLISLSGWAYDDEFFNVIREIMRGNIKQSIEAKSDLSFFDDNFYAHILKNCTNYSVDELVLGVDFFIRMWNENIKLSLVDSSGRMSLANGFNDLELKGNDLKVFIMALLRLKINLSHAYQTVNLDFNAPSIFSADGRVYSLILSIEGMDKCIINIKEDLDEFVGIKQLSKNGNHANKLPIQEGVYYSPELYRIVISLFSNIVSNIVRDKFLEESSDTN